MNIEHIMARREKLLKEAYEDIDRRNIRSLDEYSESEQVLIKKIIRAASARRKVSFGNAAGTLSKAS